jgi:hypothetical protein
MNLLKAAPDDWEERGAWKVVSTLSGILAAIAVRQAITAIWKAATSDEAAEPPLNPADRRISWTDALLWSVTAGVGAGIGRVVSQRVAAAGWERATGSTPPGIDS